MKFSIHRSIRREANVRTPSSGSVRVSSRKTGASHFGASMNTRSRFLRRAGQGATGRAGSRSRSRHGSHWSRGYRPPQSELMKRRRRVRRWPMKWRARRPGWRAPAERSVGFEACSHSGRAQPDPHPHGYRFRRRLRSLRRAVPGGRERARQLLCQATPPAARKVAVLLVLEFAALWNSKAPRRRLSRTLGVRFGSRHA